MKWKTIEGQLDQLKGKFQTTWGLIVNDDFLVIIGNKNQILGKLKKYNSFSSIKLT